METLSDLIKKYSIKSNKSLGQNFIYDTNILKKIAETQKKDSVCVEIGCGPGGLTKELSLVCKKVIGIELDAKFLPVYNQYLNNNNTKIIIANFMKIDMNELFDQYISEPFSVCANLPYYITTPILMKLLDSKLPIKNITILMQKEVAERIVSAPDSKKYGVLSIMTQARGNTKILFDLPPSVFTPSPNVVSSLLQIKIQDNIIKSDIVDFRKCVKSAFSSRRKQVKNNLSETYNISKGSIISFLKKLNLSEQIRAENLTVKDFDNLTRLLID